ncbi:hypothetical protein K4A83_14610 [Spirulina subsalsa FACHB-351]|uniref:Uncharacterized protein n=1 Tax=Spirulina subsalsa FACHB-351 TaxID=234711 RepID=A0ABT3L7K3_9CYAN|nr:hypothetical protein [Spirulina subsalsa]MCW6037496.1 hypothetical protein [Spirulina subsalsa FACHB-351]
MRQKLSDGVWSVILGVAVGTAAYGVSLSPKTGVLVGVTSGATAGASIIRLRTIVEQQHQHLQDLHQTLHQELHSATQKELNQALTQKLPQELRSAIQKWLNLPSTPSGEKTLIRTVSPPPDDPILIQTLPTVPQKALDWLTNQGITIQNYKNNQDQKVQDTELIFNRIALLLGNKYSTIKTFYKRIKHTVPKGTNFGVDLSSKTEQEIRDCTHFGKQLQKYAFLKNYWYDKNGKIIHATPQNTPQFQNFFSGEWFERFVFLKVASLLEELSLEYECVMNPQIKLPNGNNGELDLFFLIEEMPLWIECKTGNFQKHIVKYSQLRPTLKVEPERAFIVILDICEEDAEVNSKLHSIRVLNENNFTEVIAKILKGEREITVSEPSAPPVIPKTLRVSQEVQKLTTMLNKEGVRPLSTERKAVIKKLLELWNNDPTPRNVIELKALVFDRLDPEELPNFSKSKLQDIFNALLEGQCFLDAQGNSLILRKQVVHRVVSEQLEELDRRCIERYASVVLGENSDYFDSPDNVALFEKVVGGNVPPPDVLARLKTTSPK